MANTLLLKLHHVMFIECWVSETDDGRLFRQNSDIGPFLGVLFWILYKY